MPMEELAGPADGTVLPAPAEPSTLPVIAEQQPAPSEWAKLTIRVGPDQGWGSVQGSVPPDQAHHLVTAVGIVGSVAAAIAGAVLTVRISASLSVLAAAELATALAAAVLITACSFAESRRRKKR